MIDNKIKELVTLAEKTKLELSAWLDLEKNTPKAEVITDLLVTVKDSLQGARSAALNTTSVSRQRRNRIRSINVVTQDKSF